MTNVWAAGLLLMMTLCPGVGQTPFTLGVTRDVYPAEEHSNITLIWLFSVKNNKSTLSLCIYILYLKSDRIVFRYDSENEADVYELYRGRVWCDPERARTGRIECLFIDLRLNDTGTYLCEVWVDGDYSNKSCDLNVTGMNMRKTYEAEENGNVQLKLMGPDKNNSFLDSFLVYYKRPTDVKALILYHLNEGVEVSESQDGQFAGRVQCDKDALREGRIRLHVSGLRTDDSGLYLYEVFTVNNWSIGSFQLNVTPAVDQLKPQKPTVRPQPESRGRIDLYVGLTAAVLVCAELYFAF